MAPTDVAAHDGAAYPVKRRIINEFSIQVATVNGSGSQTANLVLLRSLFQMGVPVSGKNMFPSNIAGLPTWYTIRANKDGYVARKKEIDFLVAVNIETAKEDVLSLQPGKDFEIVTVSFDPRDTPATATAKKAVYLDRYKRPGAAAAWHFLTGDPASITKLTRAAGFRYVWDDQTKQFAHPTGVIVLTPEGRLARYLFGIEYGPRDLRLALVEASAGRVGTPVDALLLYCYHYNPMTGRYGLVIMRAMRIAGAATVFALTGFIFIMLRREKRQGWRSVAGPQSPAPSCQPGPF